jgi:hypothetical protein
MGLATAGASKLFETGCSSTKVMQNQAEFLLSASRTSINAKPSRFCPRHVSGCWPQNRSPTIAGVLIGFGMNRTQSLDADCKLRSFWSKI